MHGGGLESLDHPPEISNEIDQAPATVTLPHCFQIAAILALCRTPENEDALA
jgi:hypothetical protein